MEKNRRRNHAMFGKGLLAATMRELSERFSHATTEKEHRDKCIFLWLARTALRAQELVNLRWSNAILTPEGEMIFEIVRKGGKVGYANPGKEAIEAVHAYHRAAGIQGDPLFWSLPSNARTVRSALTTRGLQMIVNAWGVQTASGARVHPHALRHTAAQKAFDAAGSLAAQKLCGHASPATTSAFYTRPFIERPEEILRGSTSND